MFVATYALPKEEVMTLKQFKALSKEAQQKMVMKNGVFLADRYTPHITIVLYQLHGFYIELYFHSENNQLTWVKCFDSIDDLEPYLSEIDLSHLV